VFEHNSVIINHPIYICKFGDNSSSKKCGLPLCMATELWWAILTSKEIKYDLLPHVNRR
jgi:hypothetical protein